jgi:hypothetical protein
LQDGLDDIRDVFTDPAVLQGLSDLVGEAISLAGVVGRIAGGLGLLQLIPALVSVLYLVIITLLMKVILHSALNSLTNEGIKVRNKKTN